MSPGRWALASDVEKYRRALARAAKRVEEEEPEEIPDLGGEVAVMPADLDEIYALMEDNIRPYSIAELGELIFEVSAGSKAYRKVAKALNEALGTDERFERIGANSWSLPQMMPDEIWELPSELMVVRLDPSRLEDPEADAELSDEGLEGNLAELVHDPFYEDFGEEADAAIKVKDMPDSEISLPVLYDHLQVGTLKVRKMDRKFWPSGGPAVYASVVDDKGQHLGLWVNLHDGIIFGLGDWYRERGLQPGHLVTFSKTERADEYQLTYTGEPDKYVGLDPARLDVLHALAKEAAEADLSIFDIVVRLLAEHKKGLHFISLWAEVNLVRRTPRRVVASDLSAYHCFYPRPPQSGNWLYDERKLSQGRKKTKRKHIKKAKA
jgi:DNA-directed RNA polymerase delta subunit